MTWEAADVLIGGLGALLFAVAVYVYYCAMAYRKICRMVDGGRIVSIRLKEEGEGCDGEARR